MATQDNSPITKPINLRTVHDRTNANYLQYLPHRYLSFGHPLSEMRMIEVYVPRILSERPNSV